MFIHNFINKKGMQKYNLVSILIKTGNFIEM